MMAYVCDACGETIKNPHEVEMKEFHVRVEGCCSMPRSSERKVTIHLCDDCFHGLYTLAKAAKETAHE